MIYNFILIYLSALLISPIIKQSAFILIQHHACAGKYKYFLRFVFENYLTEQENIIEYGLILRSGCSSIILSEKKTKNKETSNTSTILSIFGLFDN